jgi:hypothetical protein
MYAMKCTIDILKKVVSKFEINSSKMVLQCIHRQSIKTPWRRDSNAQTHIAFSKMVEKDSTVYPRLRRTTFEIE